MKKLFCAFMALLVALSVPATVFAQSYDILDEFGNISYTVETSDVSPSETKAVLTNESWVKLSWNFEDWETYIDGFQLRRYYPKNKTYSDLAYTTKNEYKVKDLKPSTVYWFTVRTYVIDTNNGDYYYGAESEPFAVSTAPSAIKLKSVKYNGTGKLKVSFKRNKKASGYMLQYSTSKKFKSGPTSTVLLGKKKKAYIIKNLGNKTYFVRIRPYKEVEGIKYLGKWSDAKSASVKYGVDLKTMINATKTDLSGRKMIKKLTNKKVDIKKYKTTYDRIKAIYKWHAVHGLEFEHCLACNSHFNDCLYYLYGENRKYDNFIWIDAGNFKNRDGSLAIHKWSVLYFSGIPYIFDPRLQSYTKDYDGTLYFGVERGSSIQKRYLHDGWYCYWGNYPDMKYDETIVMYHK